MLNIIALHVKAITDEVSTQIGFFAHINTITSQLTRRALWWSVSLYNQRKWVPSPSVTENAGLPANCFGYLCRLFCNRRSWKLLGNREFRSDVQTQPSPSSIAFLHKSTHLFVCAGFEYCRFIGIAYDSHGNCVHLDRELAFRLYWLQTVLDSRESE